MIAIKLLTHCRPSVSALLLAVWASRSPKASWGFIFLYSRSSTWHFHSSNSPNSFCVCVCKGVLLKNARSPARLRHGRSVSWEQTFVQPYMKLNRIWYAVAIGASPLRLTRFLPLAAWIKKGFPPDSLGLCRHSSRQRFSSLWTVTYDGSGQAEPLPALHSSVQWHPKFSNFWAVTEGAS